MGGQIGGALAPLRSVIVSGDIAAAPPAELAS